MGICMFAGTNWKNMPVKPLENWAFFLVSALFLPLQFLFKIRITYPYKSCIFEISKDKANISQSLVFLT